MQTNVNEILKLREKQDIASKTAEQGLQRSRETQFPIYNLYTQLKYQNYEGNIKLFSFSRTKGLNLIK